MKVYECLLFDPTYGVENYLFMDETVGIEFINKELKTDEYIRGTLRTMEYDSHMRRFMCIETKQFGEENPD